MADTSAIESTEVDGISLAAVEVGIAVGVGTTTAETADLADETVFASIL